MNKKQVTSVLSIVAAALCGGFCLARADSMGTAFTYQGRLVTASGPASGTYEFQFSLYDAPTNGTLVAPGTNLPPITVTEGLFTVSMDFGAVFQGDVRYLEIKARTNAGPDWTTLPRQPLTPTPYALYANGVNAAGIAGNISPANIGAGSITTAMLAAGAVGPTQLAAGAVGTAALADSAVTSDKIATVTLISLTTLPNPTPATDDYFGWSVAPMGTDRVLVGAYYDDTGATDAGAAYLFSTNGALLTTFTNPMPAAGDNFGYSVAAVGTDRVLIGMPQWVTGLSGAGAAYLFSTNGTLLTTFTNPTPAAGDKFGWCVAAVGTDRVLIGAPYDDTGGSDAGAAYLFSTNGAMLATFTNSTPAANDFFGWSLAPVGTDRVLIGAPYDDTGGTDAGVAYLFAADGALLATFTKPIPAVGGHFGNSVAALGTDWVLVAAAGHSSGAGAAYLFSTNGALLTTFNNPTPANWDYFGSSVAAVGLNRVLIGAPYDHQPGTLPTGAAYLFTTSGALLATITNPTPADWDDFGSSVAVLGADRVVIGAYQDDAGATNAGAAYLYSVETFAPGLVAESVRANSITTSSLAEGAVTAAKIGGTLIPSQIPSLDASKITSGTLALAQLPAAVLTNNATGVSLSGNFAGDGAALTNVVASALRVPGNLYLGTFPTVSGGQDNTNRGIYSTIGGGTRNTIGATGNAATIGGGVGNTSINNNSTVGGGGGNTSSALGATVGGGEINTSSGVNSTVGGGGGNTASGGSTTVAGGNGNTSSNFGATVGGGDGNVSSGLLATAGGGNSNSVAGNYATVGGGRANRSSGNAATISGGEQNVASGDWSFAAGRQAKAQHLGAFVWADSQNLDFFSTGSNQFLIRATGNVGINKTNPSTTLDVNGTVSASAFAGDGAALTSLSASNLTGTIADARLSTNVALLNATQVFTGTNRFAGPMVATNAANQFHGIFGGDGAALTSLSASNLTGSVPAAALTSVPATNLTGLVADARLSTNVAFLHTNQVYTGENRFAGIVTATNAANEIHGIFTGHGANLTGLVAGNLTGTVEDARLSTNVSLLNATQAFVGGNRFAGTVVATNAANEIHGTFTGHGANLTGLVASNLTGTIADARLSTNVALLSANQVFAGANRFAGAVVATNAANQFHGSFSGSGAALTSLSASNLTGSVPAAALTSVPATNLTGTVADTRLSANVTLLNANQVFTGTNRFTGAVAATNAANQFAGTFSGNAGALTNVTLADGAVDHNKLASDYLSLTKVSGGYLVADASGNVGIGTSSPGNLLEIHNSGATTPGLRIHNGTGNWQLGVGVIQPYDGSFGLYDVIHDSNRLVVSPTGNVGIGTTSPLAKLDVAGDIKSNSKSVAVGEESLRIVRGVVSSNGIALKGTGFTVTSNNIGAFTIRFNSAFLDFPAVTATAVVPPPGTQTNITVCMVMSNTVSYVTIAPRDGGGLGVNRDFHFIAIGPR